MSRQLELLLSSRSIEPLTAEDAEVAGFWEKAVGSYSDSLRVRFPDSRVTLGYQAGLQAATAIVRAAGYRVRSASGGQHATTFATLAALEIDPLSELARDLSVLRTQRHRAVYASRRSDDDVSGIPLDELDRVVRKLLAAGHAWLAEDRPSLVARLEPPPQSA